MKNRIGGFERELSKDNEHGKLPTLGDLPDNGLVDGSRREKFLTTKNKTFEDQDLNLERIQKEIDEKIKKINEIEKNLKIIENIIKKGCFSNIKKEEIKKEKEVLMKEKDILISEVSKLRKQAEDIIREKRA